MSSNILRVNVSELMSLPTLMRMHSFLRSRRHQEQGTCGQRDLYSHDKMSPFALSDITFGVFSSSHSHQGKFKKQVPFTKVLYVQNGLSDL